MDRRKPQVLWEPDEAFARRTRLRAYGDWLSAHRGVAAASYHELWRWSVDDLEAFWGSIWDHFGVVSTRPYQRVLADRTMPGARWFQGAEISYSEHIFRDRRDDRVAIVHASELREQSELTWGELRDQAAWIAAGLRDLGVERGDRVVAYLPNVPEAIVAFLACASLGAIWSSCSPDFGPGSVVDRFAQIEPKVLLAVDGYRYGGRDFDRSAVVEQIHAQVGGTLVRVGQLEGSGFSQEFLGPVDAELALEPVPFDHPLWVLYSSGTTGLPKAIVHGHGGILLEQLKHQNLHLDMHAGDRAFWFTTTGWMMWNFLVGVLLAGSAIVLYDGMPDPHGMWQFAADAGITCFGTSAAFISACMKAEAKPPELPSLKSVGSTGSPLPVASNLNYVAGQTVPNLVVAKVGSGGKVSLRNNSGQTHVIADVVGWYSQ
ncbi:MAG: AMP-binding protein [Actinobacteria bacterium]|nr:AMP-binding protein [Actinomycetota bacterium]